jgi:GNAT superfamily N-acetyltransferase
MSLVWIKERPAVWNADTQRIIGGAPAGVFDASFGEMSPGAPLPGEWWRVEEDGRVVGYGWMDIVWGDAEILMATDSAARGRGVGSFILARLEDEARARGVNYLYNAVPAGHPEGDRVTRWLLARGFRASEDGSLRADVHRAAGG